MKRRIWLNNVFTLRNWVDASYRIHQDKRGHTGGIMSGGIGILHHKSSKQKLNTKSSTETEVVGASDYITYTLWMKRFLNEQGYKVNRTIYYQDNKSAMKLESNGWRSKGEKSRHIDIRYFFIQDVLKREKIDLIHCKTDKMIADYFTKPLQGDLFKTLRSYIMGEVAIPTEERVENQIENQKNNLAIDMTTKFNGQKNSYADIVRGKE